MQARTSITTWLWALVLLPTLPLLGFFGYSTYRYAAEREHTVQARLAEQADDLASQAQARLEQATGALTALSLSDAALGDDIPRLYAAAVRLQASSATLAAVSLVDRQEQLVFLSLRPLGTRLPAAQLESVRESFATGKPSLSKPFDSPINPRKVVALNVPVIREGKVVYCLRGILRVETLSDLIRPQTLDKGWIAGIFDRDGVAVARSLSPELFVGKQAGPDLLRAIDNGDRSVWRGYTKEGIETLSVARPIGPWRWTVAVAVPIQSLVAPVRQEMLQFTGVTLAMLLLLALTVARLNRHISRQLLTVVDDARRSLSGELQPSASTGIRELDDLRDSLTRADLYRSAMLQEVQQRTAELNSAKQQLTEFTQQLDDNIERERLHLAREVHDQIGAIFTGVSMLINGLPAGAMSAEQRRTINIALDQGLTTARRITTELRPPLLDHLGLQAAVEDMARTTLAPAQIASKVMLSDAEQLGARQAIGCYRIMQEAVTNVLRHARCRRCEITGHAEQGVYTFFVDDDGEGMQDTGDREGHFGMAGMRERARLMGGDMLVESRPGAGVTIRVVIPLNGPQTP